jgi:hypothetical protein
MAMSRGQNARESNNIKISNRSFERVEQFRYLRTTLTYQNYICETIKSRFVRKCKLSISAELFVFQIVIRECKDEDIQNYKFDWSLRLERRLRVFESKLLRKIFGPKQEKVNG